jgi:hypothetical protein
MKSDLIRRSVVTLAAALTAIVALVTPGAATQAQGLQVSPPLGYSDGQHYAPRVERNAAGALLEDTSYGVQNPDLAGSTCFGQPWEILYHAGQDLYRADGSSTAGAEVTAVAGGRVAYANPNLNYPGLVVIIEHDGGGNKLYSVYAHLDDNSLVVEEGQEVRRGDKLGEVMFQAYTGRNPELHPSGNDSHLHFELRAFYSGRNIYADAPACNGLVAGRGYTYPEQPGDFPRPGQGYLDPAGQIH